jgi:hypothetical protein
VLALFVIAGIGFNDHTAWAAAESTDDEAPPVTSIVSSTRHFAVRGTDPGQNLRLGIWADEVAEEMGEFIGQDVPFSDRRPVYIFAKVDPDIAEGLIAQRQAYSDGLLTQELRITNFHLLDQEDLLEALSALLLNRYAVQRQSVPARKKKLAEVPAWFSVGVAQQLFPALRERNRLVCVKQWQENRLKPVPEVLSMRFAVDGRTTLKCSCGMFLAWLHALSGADRTFDEMFTAWSTHQSVDQQWLVNHMPGLVSGKNVAKQWNLWIARASELRSEWAGDIYAVVDQLKSKLNVRPKLMNVGYPDDGMDSVSPRELLDLYDQAWFVSVIRKSSYAVNFQGMGQPEELREIIAQYQEFLETLKSLNAYHQKRSTNGLRRARSRAERQLDEANLALAKYENKLKNWKLYVDLADKSIAAESPVPEEPPVPSEVADRLSTAKQRYVDFIEQR